MFQRISIKNYKSIQSLEDFELKPVNILIGANNSGKSNFLDVFAFLRDTLRDDNFQAPQGNKHSGWGAALEKRGGGESVCFGNERHFQISCLGHPFKYSLEIALDQFGQYYQIQDEKLAAVNTEKKFFDLKLRDRTVVFYDMNERQSGSSSISERTALSGFLRENGVDSQAQNFAKRLSEIKIYDRLRTEIWSPIRIPKISKGETILDEDGGNLAGVLHQLSQTYPRFLPQLESLLRILFEDFSRIAFLSNNKGELYIRWEDKNGRIVNNSQISDGTLKLLCIVAILKNPNPPALIGIDEPDVKLHPKMQEFLSDMILEAAQRTQIIATTHDPDFVSWFDPDEIVILQQYKGATEMRRFSSKGALKLWLKDFTTRELWLMGELESRW